MLSLLKMIDKSKFVVGVFDDSELTAGIMRLSERYQVVCVW